MNKLWLCFLTLLLVGCGDEVFTPKPRGYYRVSLPRHEYKIFDRQGFPYSFEYPVYGKIEQEDYFFEEEAQNPFWVNVAIPDLGGKIHLSYKAMNGKADLEKLLNDAHYLSYFHTKKADYIDDASFSTRHDVHGMFFKVGGDAASAYQFFATDSSRHFLRGALYIDATPNADSLLPMNEFLKVDMQHLIETLQWR